MALINCPECGKEVSDMSKVCVNCGYPLQNIKNDGRVKIKLPQGDPSLWLQSKKCIIEDLTTKEILWEGRMGQIAEFYINKEKEVKIMIGTSFSNPLYCKLRPNQKYVITQHMRIHWNATYNISEIDIIDSD